MSTVPPVSDPSTSTLVTPLPSSKPKRVLACVRCQRKKIRCDRRFPCVHCKASDVQCVPATVTPRGQRRRRFPERELLERLRVYEDLLRQNNIKFEPLHKIPAGEKQSLNTQGDDESDDDQVGADWSSPAATVKSESVYEAKDYWHALNSGGHQDADDESDSSIDNMHEVLVDKGWVQLFGDNDHLLFGSPHSNVDLSTLHPEPAQIFKLWQIYLENINPLLKVTHCTSLQSRIVEAAGNLKTISPTMEALMFSIYCIAIQSLVEIDCRTIFGLPKEDLSTGFQFGCQQALQNCGFLRSSSRECLTALYLYLVSVRSSIVPQSLSAMLGVAIRIAQRMGIHSEAALAKCSVFEAELRRRLWWSLVLFDTRISEMADHKIATLTPTWDCSIPLNVNDSDLRIEMQEPPPLHGNPTDALFAVVRSEVGEFIRHTHFYMDFTSPALKPILKTAQHDSIPEAVGLANLEKMIEDKYLRFCDPENPLHFMTIWWARAYLAKCRLMEYHSRCSSPSVPQTDVQRDEAIFHAIRMLECDTMFNSSPLTKGFLWHVQLHFPFPAYLQILQDLKRRPGCEQAEQAWEAMSSNFETLLEFLRRDTERPFFDIFAKIVLQAWAACEAAVISLTKVSVPPRIVSLIRHRISQIDHNAPLAKAQQPIGVKGAEIDNCSMPIPMGSGSYGALDDTGGQIEYGAIDPSLYANVLGQPSMEVDIDHLDWSMVDWGFGGVYPAV